MSDDEISDFQKYFNTAFWFGMIFMVLAAIGVAIVVTSDDPFVLLP